MEVTILMEICECTGRSKREKTYGKYIDIDILKRSDWFWHSYFESVAANPVDKFTFKICHLSQGKSIMWTWWWKLLLKDEIKTKRSPFLISSVARYVSTQLLGLSLTSPFRITLLAILFVEIWPAYFRWEKKNNHYNFGNPLVVGEGTIPSFCWPSSKRYIFCSDEEKFFCSNEEIYFLLLEEVLVKAHRETSLYGLGRT
jgi:hypothetical protein